MLYLVLVCFVRPSNAIALLLTNNLETFPAFAVMKLSIYLHLMIDNIVINFVIAIWATSRSQENIAIK